MPYQYLNLNPLHHRTGDCVIRAISKALGQPWDETYIGICVKGLEMADLPSSNAVWGAYLKDHGFTQHLAPEKDGGVYTVEDFADDHPHGTYILALDGHVVCVQDGTVFDSWDSRHEIPHYYWTKKEDT